MSKNLGSAVEVLLGSIILRMLSTPSRCQLVTIDSAARPLLKVAMAPFDITLIKQLRLLFSARASTRRHLALPMSLHAEPHLALLQYGFRFSNI